MDGETSWILERIKLYELMKAHPDWSLRCYARELQHDVQWVRRWATRIRSATALTLDTFRSHSRSIPSTSHRHLVNLPINSRQTKCHLIIDVLLSNFKARHFSFLNITMTAYSSKRNIYRPSVFVSSTNEDLMIDCRPRAYQAIVTAGGFPVGQENFAYSKHKETALEYCLNSIESDSSHYIGLFAHRLGWIPPTFPSKFQKYQGMSITQAEYEHARSVGLEIAVFMPKPGTAFDHELIERVKGQSAEDTKAQHEFVTRVQSEGLLNCFEDVIQLSNLITRVVHEWVLLGKQSLMDFAERNTTQVSPPVTVSKRDICTLGRFKHLRMFANALDVWTNEHAYAAACFRISGEKGMGHGVLVELIQRKLRETGEVIQLPTGVVRLGIGQHKDVPQLIERLSNGMLPVPKSVPEYAEEIAKRLEKSHLLLALDAHTFAQRFEGGIEGFVRKFWSPLIETLRGIRAHKFVVLLVEEGDSSSVDWKPFLYTDDAVFEPARIIDLPVLKTFTIQDIKLWLVRELGEDSRANTLAQLVYDECQGIPEETYREICEITSYEGVQE